MKHGPLPSSASHTVDDPDMDNLQQLLDAFGSVVSLEDIAAAYCQANRNLSETAEILCYKSSSSIGESSTSKSQEDVDSTSGSSSRCQSYSHLDQLDHLDHLEDADTTTESKQKRSSASMGTVAGLIGKEYVNPKPQSYGSRETSKPVKLSSNEIPMHEIWDEGEKEDKSTSGNDSMENDMEEFLYQMLGNGFQLEKSVIQDVIGQCGYNMQMSVDKLLDMSAPIMEKSDDDVIPIASQKTMENSKGKSSVIDISGRSNTNDHDRDGFVLPRKEKKKKKDKNGDIQREVLNSLFTVPGRIDEIQESTRKVFHRPRQTPYGRAVAKPLEETVIEDFTFITRQSVKSKNDGENELSYEDLRKVVKEHWAKIKECFKSAVDAYTRKDFKIAKEFIEEGKFFMKALREAEDKSAQKLIEDSEEEVYSVNLHYFDPKEALEQLKFQLTSFCGLPSIIYLKVVVGTKDGDKKHDQRRKRHVIKLLEKEGIVWTEEDEWIISIRVDEIDPIKFSFASK